MDANEVIGPLRRPGQSRKGTGNQVAGQDKRVGRKVRRCPGTKRGYCGLVLVKGPGKHCADCRCEILGLPKPTYGPCIPVTDDDRVTAVPVGTPLFRYGPVEDLGEAP